jgi:hypothetical protein
MPNGWTRVGTPDELKALLRKPAEFRTKADELVDEAGAVVGHIFFAEDRSAAYILSHVPSDDADEIFEKLDEKIGPTERLYDAEELQRLFPEAAS